MFTTEGGDNTRINEDGNQTAEEIFNQFNKFAMA